MKPKRFVWESSITKVERNKLVTYGIDQETIICNFSYEEMVFLLLIGRKPEPVEAALLRHVIVSHCSHGITGQSTLAVRMGADTGTTFLHSAIAGFSVGSGPVHQGGLEAAMREIVAARQSGDPEAYVCNKLSRKEVVYGFGHRFHKPDPRALLHFELCDKYSFVRPNVECVKRMDRVMDKLKGVRMNIEASGGAILLDLGFPVEAASLIILIGRGPMFAAAYMERLNELRSKKKLFPKLTVYEDE